MKLKKELHFRIKLYNGRLYPVEYVEMICKKLGYKISTGERRLRPSESPNIETVYFIENGRRKHIIGYRDIPQIKEQPNGQKSFA